MCFAPKFHVRISCMKTNLVACRFIRTSESNEIWIVFTTPNWGDRSESDHLLKLHRLGFYCLPQKWEECLQVSDHVNVVLIDPNYLLGLFFSNICDESLLFAPNRFQVVYSFARQASSFFLKEPTSSISKMIYCPVSKVETTQPIFFNESTEV